MKIRQKIASLLTAMVCTVSICAGGYGSMIGEASETTSDEMKYGDYLSYKQVDENSDDVFDFVRITACEDEATEVEIPEKIEGLPVTSIRDWAFKGCISLASITIPDSVTSIGSSAFYGCTSLASITIPDSVTSIGGSSAFSGCTSLASITIPDSVTLIGNRAFEDCTSLASITIPDSVTVIGKDAFSGTALLANQTGVKYADTWVVDCDENVTSAEIKDGTRGIADYAFYGCTSLASITIPDSVTSIGYDAFSDCTSLASITIPDSVTSIGYVAFSGCTSLASITIPDSVTSIGAAAFSGTALLANQTGVKYADTWVVDCDENVTSAEIKDGTRGIADYAFSGCTSLASITIPDSVTSIGGDRAFSGCTSLASITIPDSVTSIGYGTFSGCTSLANITILNPECEIYDGSYTINNGTDENYNLYFNGTIYGYANSTAQEYAEKYGYNFEVIKETETIQGDISGNGAIDLYDAIEICKNIMGMRTFTEEEKAVADFNGDGAVNLYDAIAIAKYIMSNL